MVTTVWVTDNNAVTSPGDDNNAVISPGADNNAVTSPIAGITTAEDSDDEFATYQSGTGTSEDYEPTGIKYTLQL